MKSTITVGGGESAVTINGLNGIEGITEAAFDGITVTLTGAAVDNFSDLNITGGMADNKNGVRRIIWNGKVDGIDRNTVLIVDLNNGNLRGGWLIFGDEENCLTYYTDSSKLTADSTGSVDDDSAEINLQFVDKKTALTPRTFTFMEKYNLLSLGSAFDHVTITARDDVYISRSGLMQNAKFKMQNSIVSGVIKGKSKAKVDDGNWSFENNDSFVVDTTDSVVKFYDGSCL